MKARHWQEIEIAFSGPTATNPYTQVEAWADFTHDTGATLRRPLFWDGASTYRVRFASPLSHGAWSWNLTSADPEHRFTPDSGTIQAALGDPNDRHPARAHGFVTIAAGARTGAYADGTPFFMVADTAWAMPWRATLDDVRIYAADRVAKGFNTSLVMAMMPDMGVEGPEGRGIDHGFEVAFRDLAAGHLNDINIEYFQYFDRINSTLLDYGLTLGYQPVFDGFGWKGKDVAGPHVDPAEFARLCRYLVARYGARPATWFVCGDGSGHAPVVEAGGREIQAWDAYSHPTGIHYRPHARPNAHQSAEWLDFQSCQTGHDGDHVPDRLATMWAERPTKAIMNGEPTYENCGRLGKATGWWQGNEAWINVCAGATLGIAYGAASLWQWRLGPAEPGHAPYYIAEGAGWQEALEFSGSRYIGLVGQILEGIDLSDAEPCWDVLQRTRGIIVPHRLFLSYAEHGGIWNFLDADGRIPDTYWIIDPMTGRVTGHGSRPGNWQQIPGEDEVPSLLICANDEPPIARNQNYAASIHVATPSYT